VWRSKDAGGVIDPSSTLFDGTPLAGRPICVRRSLKYSDAFVGNLTENPADLCDGAPARVLRHGGGSDHPPQCGDNRAIGFPRLILGIVKSAPFSDGPSNVSGPGLQTRHQRSDHVRLEASPVTPHRASGSAITLALPLLDAMVPAITAQSRTAAGARRVRMACLEMVHGSAGATKFGAGKNLWSPRSRPRVRSHARRA
jgi:hypothetical protein